MANTASLNNHSSAAPLGWLFWLNFVFRTLLHRSVSAVIRGAKSAIGAYTCEGQENIPEEGSFVLAVNHYKNRTTLRVASVVLDAVGEVRPDAVDDLLMVVGRRKRKVTSLRQRFVRRIFALTLRLWNHNTVVVPLGNEVASSLSGLKEWRKRAREQPVFVFPEGVTGKEFREVRYGSGRWLRSLGVPVVPVAVWFEDGQWHVRFGPTVQWTKRSDLDDTRLGLAIARLLPEHEHGAWSELLARLELRKRQKVAEAS